MGDISVPEHIFREYDIRGVYGKDLTDEVAEAIGRAYAAYVREEGLLKDPITVSIARDVRLSSDALRDALVRGLTESGVNCVDIGVCPTPLQYFSMQTLTVNGGFMITGSHNPPEYNGFKISIGKETIHGEEIKAIGRALQRVLEEPAGPANPPGEARSVEIIPSYIEYVKGLFSLPATERPIRVVIDCGNGTAGPVAVPLLRNLGCEVEDIYCLPDGNFPNHHPDPTVPENLADLIETVRAKKADMGIAYDGDADRIGVVDEQGGIIWGDKLMVIFARDILESAPGATIVGEVKCSQVLYDEIEKAGGRAVMWKTGHSLIKSRMKELGAAMAGEMSGHIFFADRYFGYDDAVYASCRLVEILAKKRAADPGATLSGLLAGLPSTTVTPEIRIECADEKKFKVIEKLAGALETNAGGDAALEIKDIITIDGLRMNFDGGWALVRASNTQPVLVMRFEATSEELLEKAKTFVKEKLEEVEPGLELNF
jgi:phosphomannomutase/phosphoglucomutase